MCVYLHIITSLCHTIYISLSITDEYEIKNVVGQRIELCLQFYMVTLFHSFLLKFLDNGKARASAFSCYRNIGPHLLQICVAIATVTMNTWWNKAKKVQFHIID